MLDVDSRWSRILQVGIRVMTHLIDTCLAHHREVKVINEIGNHDDHTAIMLSVALDHHYHQEPRVDIDLSPARFHYHTFGKNLIGVTHGHSAKPESLESIMAYDMADHWSLPYPRTVFGTAGIFTIHVSSNTETALWSLSAPLRPGTHGLQRVGTAQGVT